MSSEVWPRDWTDQHTIIFIDNWIGSEKIMNISRQFITVLKWTVICEGNTWWFRQAWNTQKAKFLSMRQLGIHIIPTLERIFSANTWEINFGSFLKCLASFLWNVYQHLNFVIRSFNFIAISNGNKIQDSKLQEFSIIINCFSRLLYKAFT